MIVDVVALRRDGRRIPEFELRTFVPFRADLGIEQEGMDGCVARVRAPTSREELQRPLINVRVCPMRGDSFVVAGVQQTNPPGTALLIQRQAWWCRLPRDDLAVAQRALLSKLLGIGTGVLADVE